MTNALSFSLSVGPQVWKRWARWGRKTPATAEACTNVRFLDTFPTYFQRNKSPDSQNAHVRGQITRGDLDATLILPTKFMVNLPQSDQSIRTQAQQPASHWWNEPPTSCFSVSLATISLCSTRESSSISSSSWEDSKDSDNFCCLGAKQEAVTYSGVYLCHAFWMPTGDTGRPTFFVPLMACPERGELPEA